MKSSRSRREKTLYIIGAESVRYGEIMRIIDAAKAGGVTAIGIVTAEMRRGREARDDQERR